MRILGICDPPADQAYSRGTHVIIRTERGLEAGEILCESGRATAVPEGSPAAQILRPMTAEDANELSRIHDHEHKEFQVCLRCIQDLGLPMQLVDVEHIFGGERIVVYYLADGRVDFRELVKVLAGEFQTRIEMRQIGVRDEAKLLADYGDCGQPVCCNNHLVTMPPVSMKMAKLQKATLDPTKISGRCGRLKCCLRYEYETYEQALKELPPIGARVNTKEGSARVVGQEILAGKILLETEARTRILVDAADVAVLASEEKARPHGDSEDPQIA
ncbi:MAG: signal peptidase [Pirellulales bacterium]|nr:signal peptidase [Pirellulales bacterium]